jgi:hypothetical protein
VELENRIAALENAQRTRPKIPFLVVYEYRGETIEDAEEREGVKPEEYDTVLIVRYRKEGTHVETD